MQPEIGPFSHNFVTNSIVVYSKRRNSHLHYLNLSESLCSISEMAHPFARPPNMRSILYHEHCCFGKLKKTIRPYNSR